MNDSLHQKFVDIFSAEQNEISSKLKKYLLSLPPEKFSLGELTRFTGFIDNESFSFNILSIQKNSDTIQVKLGLFFNEIMGGCNCSEEPFHEINYSEANYLLTKSGIALLKEIK
ncbi:MAG: hypothetical protein HQL46_04200 [Gammaproteobacteria bacterium]|nr:hypothetical protein [Gammaproteobacteria bacterium]